MLRVLSTIAFALALAAPAAHAAGDAAAGKKKFTETLPCWTCHGKEGKGDGPAGAALNPPPRDFTKGEFKFDANKDGKPGEDADLVLVIKNAPVAYGGNPAMPPFNYLSDQDIADLIAYIRTLKK